MSDAQSNLKTFAAFNAACVALLKQINPDLQKNQRRLELLSISFGMDLLTDQGLKSACIQHTSPERQEEILSKFTMPTIDSLNPELKKFYCSKG